jgi:ribosome maturation factor RimP
MRQVPGDLNDLIEPIVVGLGYECVGIEYIAHPKHAVLRVYIDSEDGVVLADCSKVSHQLSGALDVENPIRGNYQLEVSSPGVDRPLMKPEHFDRFKGHAIRIELMQPLDGRRKFKSVLLGLSGRDVLLQEEEQIVKIPFEKIKTARLVPDFDKERSGRT